MTRPLTRRNRTSDGNDGERPVSPRALGPASGSSKLLFHYRDLTAVRQYKNELRADVVESVPTLPDGESREVVEQVTDGESAGRFRVQVRFRGRCRNVVVSGSFDPGAVDADLESTAGDFEVFERDDVSVAVSAETVVVSLPTARISKRSSRRALREPIAESMRTETSRS